MTDKDQIIVDGVNVSGCKHFLKDTEGQDYDTDEFIKGCCEAKGSCIGYEFAGYGLCRGDKDCYFKQLARKTQECEQIKEKYEALKLENQEGYEIVDELKQECEELKKTVLTKCPNCNSEYLTSKGIELYEENKKLKKECEELKERLVRTEEDLKYQCVDCMNVKSDRYRRALEEIKEYTREQFCDNCEDIGSTEHNCHCEYCEYQEYFDIINKAKGEENEG